MVPLVLMTGIPVGTARTEADEMRRRMEMKNFILTEAGILKKKKKKCGRESCGRRNTVLLRRITNFVMKKGSSRPTEKRKYGSWPQSENESSSVCGLDEHRQLWQMRRLCCHLMKASTQNHAYQTSSIFTGQNFYIRQNQYRTVTRVKQRRTLRHPQLGTAPT